MSSLSIRGARPTTREVVQIIEPPGGRLDLRLREIWEFRELFAFLTWRDIKVRYKQTLLGATWAILQPVMSMIVFTLFFGRLAGLEQKTGGVPYPIYVFAGLLPWTFFAGAIQTSGASVVGSAHLITKVYFPRLIVPLAAVGAGIVDLALSSLVLVALMAYYQIAVTGYLALLPLIVAGTLLAATGVGALLAALTAMYRDFRYVVPFLVQTWMFITPVIYPSTLVPERWRGLLALNPMSGLIEGFRASFLGRAPDWQHVAISLAVAAALFAFGALAFQKVERRLADVI